MIRLTGIARPGSVLTVLVAACLLFTITPADAASSKKKSKGLSPAASVALQYAEAISKGDHIKTVNLDFACQYRLLVAKQPHPASPHRLMPPLIRVCRDSKRRMNRPWLEWTAGWMCSGPPTVLYPFSVTISTTIRHRLL